jgi:hypothetical protein
MPIAVLAGMAVAQIALALPSLALECPEPQTQSGAGVIEEPQQEIARLSDMMRAGDLDNRVEVIARDLKDKYAQADKTELTNFMVAAYCPVIAEDAGLSESEKDTKLTEFSQMVSDLYSAAGM